MEYIVENGIKRLYGIYRAVVVNNVDPLKQRRLQLRIQTSPDAPTAWVLPFDTSNITAEVPVIGQGVWVQFLSGDPEYPVWFGHFGKNKGKNKRVFVSPLSDSVSLTGLTSYLIIKNQPDGTKEIDLVATLLAMAEKLKDHETRITSLESRVTAAESDLSALHGTLATRTSPSHTHTSAG